MRGFASREHTAEERDLRPYLYVPAAPCVCHHVAVANSVSSVPWSLTLYQVIAGSPDRPLEALGEYPRSKAPGREQRAPAARMKRLGFFVAQRARQLRLKHLSLSMSSWLIA